VVGNGATNTCEIVTSNPIAIGDIWFEDGLFKSLEDAKLARSTVAACRRRIPTPNAADQCSALLPRTKGRLRATAA